MTYTLKEAEQIEKPVRGGGSHEAFDEISRTSTYTNPAHAHRKVMKLKWYKQSPYKRQITE